ncbi:helix-turn-helix domain-containing protein [Companilactobacillus metriopterae]|uniref:helix-turn-helix domain-containing protein n=1 Tax=Companilactobacillus metriopterae TaxID=1909267 RepID=UPI00100B6643|nr:helix-turn-helix transcriptional regulator [Companilactobacillus metriopterae]
MNYIPEDKLAVSLGQRIASERKLNNLSQKQLAEDICSQSMISSIEKGIYVPNAILLSRLCMRLNISMDNAVLSSYLEIEDMEGFNEKIKSLCNNHDYSGMLKYLDDSKIIDQLYKNQDFQTYYYYYAVATYQYLNDRRESLRLLNLAYQYTYSKGQKSFIPNEILILSVIAYIKVQSNDVTSGFKDFETVLKIIEDNRFSSYNENINILYYLYGVCLHETKQYRKSIKILNDGINWTTLHSSYYMLSDLFLALSKSYDSLNNKSEAHKAVLKSETIEDVFKQYAYKKD